MEDPNATNPAAPADDSATGDATVTDPGVTSPVGDTGEVHDDTPAETPGAPAAPVNEPADPMAPPAAPVDAPAEGHEEAPAVPGAEEPAQ